MSIKYKTIVSEYAGIHGQNVSRKNYIRMKTSINCQLNYDRIQYQVTHPELREDTQGPSKVGIVRSLPALLYVYP